MKNAKLRESGPSIDHVASLFMQGSTEEDVQHSEDRTFHGFGNRPPEIRDQIWGLAAYAKREVVSLQSFLFLPRPRTFLLANNLQTLLLEVHDTDIFENSVEYRPVFRNTTAAPGLLNATYNSREVALSILNPTDPNNPLNPVPFNYMRVQPALGLQSIASSWIPRLLSWIRRI